MNYPDIPSFISDHKATLKKGPVAVVLLEDEAEVDSTLRHVIACGFKCIVTCGDPKITIHEDILPHIHRVDYDMTQEAAMSKAVNAVIKAAAGQWIHYCYNAEYFFFPFCEHRLVQEMIGFLMEERRESVLTYVVDLYAGDIAQNPNAVAFDDAYLDGAGYYALARKDSKDNFAERQLDFYGGLRWRHEEHVPYLRRRIDRVSLFRAKPDLVLSEDHTLSDPEFNTYACPWHHSLTASLCSFRTAKALKRNPGSASQIHTFKWHNSVQFEWHSQQLMDLGLMEPGQWF